MSPGLETIRAFRVSCGTRLAPRNSKASTTCPLGFTAGAASCLGVSNCGGGTCWAAGGATGAAGGAGAGAGCCSAGMVSKGLGFGGVAGGVCVCGCAGGWLAGGCCATAWTDNPEQMEMTQTQAGITTRRRRLKSFMQAYLSTLRGYDDVETQATVSQLQLRFQRW